MNQPARLSDFEWLFDIAKAHGYSYERVKEIAKKRYPLTFTDTDDWLISKDEITELGIYLCLEKP